MKPIGADESDCTVTLQSGTGHVKRPGGGGWTLIATHIEITTVDFGAMNAPDMRPVPLLAFLWARKRKPLPDMLGGATMTGKREPDVNPDKCQVKGCPGTMRGRRVVDETRRICQTCGAKEKP